MLHFAPTIAGGAPLWASFIGEDVAFTVSPAGLAGGAAFGVPTFTFSWPSAFVVSPSGSGSVAAFGAPTFSFEHPAGLSLVTLAEVKQYMDMSLSMGLPDFAVQAAINETIPYVPALAAAGYTEANQKMVQCIAAVIVAAAGSPRTLTSQHAPSGASRSFKAYDDALTWLRRTLSARDPAGVMADLIGPDPKAATLFMVV